MINPLPLRVSHRGNRASLDCNVKRLPSNHTVLLVAAIGALVACSSNPTPTPTGPGQKPAPPPFPTTFEPMAPLEEPLPPGADQHGLPYLQSVFARIGEPWATFLEDCRLRLPPEHPLNNMRLEVTVHMTIDGEGKLHGAAIEKASGRPEFDAVALEIIRDAAPYAKPNVEFISDHDRIHVVWLLARDRRQAGVATARVKKLLWPPARAVPKFLAQNDLQTAAYRLLSELERTGRQASQEFVQLGTRIAEAAAREVLASEDPVAQLLGIEMVTAMKSASAAEGLRAIIDTSVNMPVRAHAIRALGVIGDRGAVPILLGTLETAKGSGVGGKLDASIASAVALDALGSGDVARSTVYGWFQEKNVQSLWAALVVMSEFPVPEAVPELADLIADTARSRKLRTAACIALGGATTRANANDNLKILRGHFTDKNAAVRAACMQAVSHIARLSIKSRFTYWKLVENIKKDRDERVRAAAVRAAIALEPGLFHSELYALRKEKSPMVLAALAEGLARVPDALAYQKLVKLAGHDKPQVRRTAVAALAVHPDSRAKKVIAVYASDADMVVRTAAIRSLTDVATLTSLLDSETVEVRRAAFAALIRQSGRSAQLERMLRSLLDSPEKSLQRAHLAAAWLRLD